MQQSYGRGDSVNETCSERSATQICQINQPRISHIKCACGSDLWVTYWHFLLQIGVHICYVCVCLNWIQNCYFWCKAGLFLAHTQLWDFICSLLYRSLLAQYHYPQMVSPQLLNSWRFCPCHLQIALNPVRFMYTITATIQWLFSVKYTLNLHWYELNDSIFYLKQRGEEKHELKIWKL